MDGGLSNFRLLCIKITQGCNQVPKEEVVQRVNSLKQAVRQLIEHTEKLIDDQSSQQCAAKGPSAVKMDFLKVGLYTTLKR